MQGDSVHGVTMKEDSLYGVGMRLFELRGVVPSFSRTAPSDSDTTICLAAHAWDDYWDDNKQYRYYCCQFSHGKKILPYHFSFLKLLRVYHTFPPNSTNSRYKKVYIFPPVSFVFSQLLVYNKSVNCPAGNNTIRRNRKWKDTKAQKNSTPLWESILIKPLKP